MARRRDSVATFSAAAVDLLSCGLAAAAVLWLLVLPNSGQTGIGTQERVNAVVRVSQYGIGHIFSPSNSLVPDITVDFGDGTPLVNAFVQGHNSKLISMEKSGDWVSELTFESSTLVEDKPKISIKTKGSDGAFAGDLSINFENVKPNANVTIHVRICEADTAPHAISILQADRKGVNERVYLHQDINKLNSALSKDGSTHGLAKWLSENPDFSILAKRKFVPYTWLDGHPTASKVNFRATSKGSVEVLFDRPVNPTSSEQLSEIDYSIIRKLKCWSTDHKETGC